MKKIYFVLQFLALGSLACAQTPLAQISIESPSYVCTPGQCTLLTTSHTTFKAATDYVVESIPYNPSFPYYGGTTINASADDKWSPEVALPFTFNFYGNCYNSLLVGSNGVVTFDLIGNNPLGDCPWQFGQTIPNANFPIRNAIYGVYQDSNIEAPPVTNPAFQNVNYFVLDTGANATPNRVFVVNFNELPTYQCGTSVGLQTSQIVIHESTNIIEVFVKSRTACTSWNAGSGVIGIQNQAGTAAVVPAGRNTGTWAATNEAWRFTPSGAELPVTYQWYANGVLIPNETADSLIACPQENFTYQIDMNILGCNSNIVVHSNSVSDLLLPDPGLAAPYDLSVCTQSPFVYTIDLTTNAAVVLGALPAQDYEFLYYENLQDAEDTNNNNITQPVNYTFSENKTIYMVVENVVFGCRYIKPFALTINPPVAPPTGAPNQDFTSGQTLADLHVEGTNLTWYDSPVGGNMLPSNTLLQDDTTYYASQIVNGCESNRGNAPTRLAITVNLIFLANETFTTGVFSVFPNPVTDKLTVKARENIKSIGLFNTLGQQVLQSNPNLNESQINMTHLNSGVYFLKLDSEKESRLVKILKK